MASTAQEIALMKQRMDSMENKIDGMDEKLDNLTKKLLDPDFGVVSRVNQNTQARKLISRAIWSLYIIVLTALASLFFGR
jgi:hypothetical protein